MDSIPRSLNAIFNTLIILSAAVISLPAKGNDAPEIHPFQLSPKLKIGDSASFLCSVMRGQIPLTFKWYKNGNLLHNHSKDTLTNEKFSTLVIDPVTATSAGNYTCVVSNSYGTTSHSAVLVVRAPPYWIKEPEDIETIEGLSASLQCYAGGTPQPQISWKKTGSSFKEKYDKHREETVSSINGTLLLNPVLKDHEGSYVCEVNNEVGDRLQKKVSLIIHDAPKVIPFTFPEMVEIQEKTSVACILKQGIPPLKFKWLKNNREISESTNMKIKTLDDFSVITIEPVSPNDSGNYTCSVTNTFGKDDHTAVLVVEAPSRWVLEPSDVEIMEGKSATLMCVADGLPPPTYTWRKWGGKESVILENVKNGNLTFQRVNVENAGKYICEAENGIGEKLRKVANLVIHVPARFDEKFTVVTVKKGDSASLRCEAIGDQPLSVIWKRDGKELRKINGGRYEIFETLTPKGLKSELVLREADRTDGQLYTCLTENPYGKDERSIKLLVMEVPATPLDLKVQEVWSRSVSVSWSPPYTGNSPITKYVLQYWRDATSGGRHRLEEKVVTSAQTSALIKDLHPGTNYGLAIVAENTVGRGEPSDTVSFSTGEEEPSGAPMDVNVDVKGAASLLVTWKAPPKSEWNGKLKGYYVGYKIMHDSNHPYSFKTVDYVPGGVQEHMITSLRKDTEYSIIVKAFNSAGSGPPSQDVIVRTLGGDLPPAPIVFVVATSETSIKIQWRSADTKSPISGHAIHYRKKGEGWQRVAVTSANENSYTLTGLHGGAFYQLYVTANSDYGEGDPSDVVTVKTYAGTDNVVLLAGAKEAPLMLDMSLLIPVAASLLAVTVVIVAVCIWVLKAKSRRNLERAIQEDKRYIYAAATQRYVDIDKTRSLPAYHDPALINFPTPYATVPMGDDISEGGGKDDPNQEMKSFLPQNMKDRPLPKPGSLKKQRESHIYDSPQ